MTAPTISPRYAALLAKSPPRVVRSEDENEESIRILEEMGQRNDLDEDEKQFAELLTVLVENFEESVTSCYDQHPLRLLQS